MNEDMEEDTRQYTFKQIHYHRPVLGFIFHSIRKQANNKFNFTYLEVFLG